jgi:glycosyltransferase involved in cell wall biosynthesis
MKTSACIVIPAYQPKSNLLELIASLLKTADKSQEIDAKIIVVNDGSTDAESAEVFAKISLIFKNVILLHHKKNLGKGTALKTAFIYIKENFDSPTWVVTADADGQHLASDIWKIVEAGISSKTPTIGVRIFNKNVPLRSLLGNIITHFLFNFAHKKKISDTQSGLRGFYSNEIPSLLALKSRGYAFELDALIYFTNISKVREIPITTVYEPGNPTSHFRPLLDSVAIYAVLFRQILTSTLGMFIEIILFLTISYLGLGSAIALPISRFISCSVLFLLARNFVFNSNGNVFFSVAIIKFSEDILSMSKLTGLFLSYILMFFINFTIQKYLIFYRSLV